MRTVFSRHHWPVVGCLAAVLLSVAGLPPRQGGTGQTLTEAQRQNILRRVEAMPKIDAHVHVWGIPLEHQDALLKLLDRHNFRWLDICTRGLEWSQLQEQMELARGLNARRKDRVEWAASFNLSNWGQAGWQQSALDTIAAAFSKKALAVKVWKEIGMALRDPDGRFVMIDDRRFDPIFDLVEREGRTLATHLGEPRDCWLPLNEMIADSARNYFTRNPQFHAYLHKEIPGYEDQLAAQDRMLDRHPKLRVVAVHLASLEYDVDRLAAWLDRHPRAAVDFSARIQNLQMQPRDKVRAFLMKYQDRILYGTDMIMGNASGGPPPELSDMAARLELSYSRDAAWLATDAWVEVPRASPTYKSRGVELPDPVLRKIYFENARRWYHGW